jgi:SHS2 domain-containing protein
MDSDSASGYREIAHTADWELEVWAPDLSSLLIKAALGMYQLTGTQIAPVPRISRHIRLQCQEQETLLIEFLNELLYLGDSEQLAFDEFALQIDGNQLEAEMRGGKIKSMSKEIKAATYHNLNIKRSEQGLIANVVFDV